MINPICKPIHKSTVKAQLRKGIPFKGFMAPSNVSAYHVNNGWHIGMAVIFTSIDQMNDEITAYAFYNCNSELGQRVRLWIEGA